PPWAGANCRIASIVDQTNLVNEPGTDSSPTPEQQPQSSATPKMGFVQRRLPWLLAGGVLLLYCLTLPRWITFLGAGPLARAAGWDWHPALNVPLQYLLTYPCRWLPPGLQLVALNFFAAVCAALT